VLVLQQQQEQQAPGLGVPPFPMPPPASWEQIQWPPSKKAAPTIIHIPANRANGDVQFLGGGRVLL
jgi:hypothetical protein